MTVPDDVESRLKADPDICPCGCDLMGRPRAKAWKDGLPPHNKGCQCKRCKGGRTRPRSGKRERRIAKDVGGERMVLSGALSGVDVTGPVDIEETANVTLVRGLFSWWRSKQIQAKTKRLMDRRLLPRAFVCWDGRQGLVVMPYADWVSLVREATMEAP